MRDPILTYQAVLEERGLLDTRKADAVRAEVAAEVRDAVRFAVDSAEPPQEALWEDIYVS